MNQNADFCNEMPHSHAGLSTATKVFDDSLHIAAHGATTYDQHDNIADAATTSHSDCSEMCFTLLCKAQPQQKGRATVTL